MIDHALVKRKLHLNQQELKWLEEFSDLTIDAVVKDPRKYAACERFLERLISRAIDINQHLIAAKGDVTLNVLRYRDTFLCLADIGVYSREFAQKIAPSAGLRNALVHNYNNLDLTILRKSVREAIREFNQYAKHILAFLEREP